MKKLAIATTIAAAFVSAGANAAVSSNITAILLETSGLAITVPCTNGFNTGLELTGIGIGRAEINLEGNVCLDPSLAGNPLVALEFNLRGEAVTSPNPGTLFDRGSVDIFVDSGSGWVLYDRVDASIIQKFIYCVDNATADGIQWTAASNPLPGVVPANDDPACQTTLFGMPSDLYLDGTNDR